AIHEQAKNVDDKTMMLQYFETLQVVGRSNSTKFVIPMELTALMTRLTNNMLDMDTIRPLRGNPPSGD
ncbi:MAG: hypothetical protein ACOYL5_16340, partial [Phototrophicaceae bacterium]